MAYIGSASGCLVLDGMIVGNSAGASPTGNTTSLVKVGAGTIEMRGNYSNLYQGNTVVLDGTLALNKGCGAVVHPGQPDYRRQRLRSTRRRQRRPRSTSSAPNRLLDSKA